MERYKKLFSQFLPSLTNIQNSIARGELHQKFGASVKNLKDVWMKCLKLYPTSLRFLTDINDVKTVSYF